MFSVTHHSPNNTEPVIQNLACHEKMYTTYILVHFSMATLEDDDNTICSPFLIRIYMLEHSCIPQIVKDDAIATAWS